MIAQQARDQCSVHGLSCPVGHDVAQYLFSQKRQVANQVQHFVAYEFVRKAQGRIFNAILGQHHAVVAGGAANQTHFTHSALVLARTKRPRRSNFAKVIPVRQLHLQRFFADQRVRKIDGVGNGIAVSGIYGDELVAFAQFQRVANPKIRPGASLFPDPCLMYQFHKRPGTAVKDGKLQIVELDDRVINSRSNERREQVLSGRNQYTFFHQAGSVTDACDVPADGLDFKIVKVDAAKYNARAGGRGKDSQMYGSAAVQADASALHRRTNCLFVSQSWLRYLLLDDEITAPGEKYGCGVLATYRGYLPTLPPEAPLSSNPTAS